MFTFNLSFDHARFLFKCPIAFSVTCVRCWISNLHHLFCFWVREIIYYFDTIYFINAFIIFRSIDYHHFSFFSLLMMSNAILSLLALVFEIIVWYFRSLRQSVWCRSRIEGLTPPMENPFFYSCFIIIFQFTFHNVILLIN